MPVRLATAADAEAVARVQERGWQQAYRDVFPPHELDRGGFVQVERWRRRLAAPPPGWATYVADGDGDGAEIAGFVCIGGSRDARRCGEVYAIYVDPDRWAGGVGRTLLSCAEEALARRWPAATLWVLALNDRARRFYERAGWSPDGARKHESWFGVEAEEVRYRKELARASSSRS
jgi:GNAT superfamily N-acetyltransferase